MYRSAAKRLLVLYVNECFQSSLRIRTLAPRFRLRFLSSSATDPPPPFPNQNPNGFDTASSSSSSSSSSSRTESESFRNRPESDNKRRIPPRADYKEEQARVLAASLHHVIRLGWTEAAMMAGAREVGVSPSIVGAFPRKEAALVEFFMDECLQSVIDAIDSGELKLQALVPSERIVKLVKFRLEMQAPYISKWPQALSIQALPPNFPTNFKQRAILVDEMWHASGDEGSDVDWYVKRTVLGGIYSATEVYMLTDNSPDFCDTWTFLNDRVRDAFDLKKTFQEVKYLAEAVGAGVGGSLQGFMKKGYYD